MSQQKTQAKTSGAQTPVTPASFPAPLSPQWAFVVQLREGTALTPDALQGRAEHIVSGQATLFVSLEELMAFMEQVLTASRKGEME